MSLRTLRRSIEDKCDVIQAILPFNYRFTEAVKQQLAGVRSGLADATTKHLEELEYVLQRNIDVFASRFGCRMDPSVFAMMFIQACRSGTIPLFSKADIDALCSSKFADGDATWEGYSPHLLLQVHCDWVVNLDGFAYRYYLAEATLYEDMAFAFNAALQIDTQADSDGNADANVELKRHLFHLRTAILSAFYFVEAFLNGIAFDYCYRNRATLSSEMRAFLLEEPEPPRKQGFVAFEKKATQYLKVITGAQHPPLQENNCPPLKFILNEGKKLRDSIVHMSPKLHAVSRKPHKIENMVSLRLDQVAETVDAAVALVREINAKLGSNGMPLKWLYSRTSNGSFPDETFL